MIEDSAKPNKVRAYLKLLGNPYASLSILDEFDGPAAPTPSFEDKQAYFKILEDPHAYGSIFGELEDNNEILEKELDEVLSLYKPYVAQSDWKRVEDYRPVFMKKATETAARAEQIIGRLRGLRFSLSPGEKVEFNRAPAVRIISELEKILTSNR
jgi:hypothetical protein